MTDKTPPPVPPSAPVPPESPARVDEKRQRILDAGLALFARKGYHATAVPEIAQTASVATGTIYRHFATKDALFNAVYLHWQSALTAMMETRGDTCLPVAERFAADWHRLVVWHRDHPDASAFLDSHAAMAELEDDARAATHAYRMALQGIVGAAMDRQEIRMSPPEVTASVLHHAAAGLARDARAGALALTDPVIDAAGRLLWLGLAR